jgi:hypothetical protein
MDSHKLRELLKTVASIREGAEAAEVAKTVMWYWSRGAECLSEKHLRKLEIFLLGRLKERIARLEAVTRFGEREENCK